MLRQFRIDPPEPWPGLLPRPRLLRTLSQRWQHRVIHLTGGPGLGKTSLLAQAIAENRLSPRGEDVWVAIEPADADAPHLAHVVATALARSEPGSGHGHGHGPAGTGPTADRPEHPLGPTPEPDEVADALWQRAPTEACLVVDDFHRVAPGSSGAAWFGELVDALPANGHVVIASRADPPPALTDRRGPGELLDLAEADLRFDDVELSGFAFRRGIDPDRVADSGGWPAMAELAARAGPASADGYLWEQALAPLGADRRYVLAVVCELGGADDELVAAALGHRVDLTAALSTVPLVSRRPGGWFVPHDLWSSTPVLRLAPGESAEVRRRAVAHLLERRRFDEAFELISAAGLWDAAPALLREACLASDRVPADDLARWMALSPAEVRGSAAGVLAGGFHAVMTTPETATPALLDAVARSRDEGDVDAEVGALAQLGLMAWSQQEPLTLEETSPRLAQLQAAGHPVADALMTLRAAFLADLEGDEERVLVELARIRPGVLPGVSEALVGALTAAVHLSLGRPDVSLRIVERLAVTSDPAVAWYFDAAGLLGLHGVGRIDDALAVLPELAARARATGLVPVLYPCMCLGSVVASHAGDLATAREFAADAHRLLPRPPDRLPVLTALATASLHVAEGDEPAAAAVLTTAIARRGIDRGMLRRWWRHSLAFSYVLAPAARAHWESVALPGRLGTARDLAALVVGLRQGDDPATLLGPVEVPAVDVIRGLLHHRHAAELAAGLTAAGRPEGATLLDALGPTGRRAVRDLAEAADDAARTLLAATPAPPPRPVHVTVLGPIEVLHDDVGVELSPADQELLAFLVLHRRTTRVDLAAALTHHDLDRALDRLAHRLDPGHRAGTPAYVLRQSTTMIRLVTGDHVRVDVDVLDHHREAAAEAEHDGHPAVALEHHLAATRLYRGDLADDVTGAPWLDEPRERYRRRFVASAVRSAQLLLAHDEAERAEQAADRALAVDPWSEEAYAILVGVALARGDRSSATKLLSRCLDALAEHGVKPSEATHRLHRRAFSPD